MGCSHSAHRSDANLTQQGEEQQDSSYPVKKQQFAKNQVVPEKFEGRCERDACTASRKNRVSIIRNEEPVLSYAALAGRYAFLKEL
jgi:hypothetical protein